MGGWVPRRNLTAMRTHIPAVCGMYSAALDDFKRAGVIRPAVVEGADLAPPRQPAFPQPAPAARAYPGARASRVWVGIVCTGLALLAPARARAALYNLHWDVPVGLAQFLSTLDTETQTLTWHPSTLWVGAEAGNPAAIWGPPSLIWPEVLPGWVLLPTYLTWPDGTSTLFQYLQYQSDPALPGAGRYEVPPSVPALPVPLTFYQSEMLSGGLVRFTLDPSRDDVLDGALVHAPEPGAMSLLAALALCGLVVLRRPC